MREEERDERVPFSTPINLGIAIYVASQARSCNYARMVDDVPRHCIVLGQADSAFFICLFIFAQIRHVKPFATGEKFFSSPEEVP